MEARDQDVGEVAPVEDQCVGEEGVEEPIEPVDLGLREATLREQGADRVKEFGAVQARESARVGGRGHGRLR